MLTMLLSLLATARAAAARWIRVLAATGFGLLLAAIGVATAAR